MKSIGLNRMKFSLCTSLCLCLVACSTTSAAFLTVISNNNALAYYLDGSGRNGSFDEIRFDSRIYGKPIFTGNNSGLVSGSPRPAGQALTYPNRMLNSDPLDDPTFLGFVISDLSNQPRWLSFTVTNPHGGITTATQPQGWLFLANVNTSAHYLVEDSYVFTRVWLVSQGRIITRLSHGVPLTPRVSEPAAFSFALAGMGLLGLFAVGRRKA
jgi:PEP-CTERM motif-containing protein